jgi:transcriptional regulator with XRE-family HTH domain
MNLFQKYLKSYFSKEGALSQTEVAKRACVSRVFLNRIVNRRAVPTLPVAEKIATATGSPLSTILRKMKKIEKSA